MKVTRNLFTIADLVKWMDEKSLVVNRDYQRSPGLWPSNARSYFIDTILNGYPFPKVTIRQTINLRTKQSYREIIDGQQRLTAIYDFVNNKFALSNVSKAYAKSKFLDLDEVNKQNLLSYEVSVDSIIAATEEEVLEIFRRMNSYNVPLNEQEKRHSTYQGEFKWFIKDLLDSYTPMLEAFDVLSKTQVSRMADADLMTELCQVLMEGIQTRSNKKLDDLYRNNDRVFHEKDEIGPKIKEAMNFIKIELSVFGEQKVLNGFLIYSIFAALIFNMWGIKNTKKTQIANFEPINKFASNIDKAIQNISDLLRAVEEKDIEGNYKEFVTSCLSSTHRLNNRSVRLKWFIAALQDKMDDETLFA